MSRRALLLLWLMSLATTGRASSPRPLAPLRAQTPPVIDGRLDDELWREAPSVRGFKTWHPDFGKDMPDDTIVYLAYDRENLYFAFRSLDREPQKIKASVTARAFLPRRKRVLERGRPDAARSAAGRCAYAQHHQSFGGRQGLGQDGDQKHARGAVCPR